MKIEKSVTINGEVVEIAFDNFLGHEVYVDKVEENYYFVDKSGDIKGTTRLETWTSQGQGLADLNFNEDVE